jgi:hypothetical protein
VARLVDVEPALPRQRAANFLVGWFQRCARLVDELHQFARADREAQHVAAKSLNQQIRHVARPFLIGQQRRQSRADEAAVHDLARQRRRLDPAALDVAVQLCAMLDDVEPLLAQLHLLHEAKLVERLPVSLGL